MDVFFQHHPCIQESLAIGENFKSLNTGSVALLRAPQKPLLQAPNPGYLHLPFWISKGEAEKAFTGKQRGAFPASPCGSEWVGVGLGYSKCGRCRETDRHTHTHKPSPSLLLWTGYKSARILGWFREQETSTGFQLCFYSRWSYFLFYSFVPLPSASVQGWVHSLYGHQWRCVWLRDICNNAATSILT